MKKAAVIFLLAAGALLIVLSSALSVRAEVGSAPVAASLPNAQTDAQASVPLTPEAGAIGRVPLSPRRVDRAMRRGMAYLYSQQKPTGSWEAVDQSVPWDYGSEPFPIHQNIYGGQYGGTTAMVVFALLSAGESPVDPRVAKGIEWLRKTPMHGIYALSMRMNAFALLPGEPAKNQMRSDEQAILHGIVPQKDSKGKPNAGWGLYSYLDKPSSAVDHSVSQYGVLGAWESALRGMDPGTAYWAMVQHAWERDQNDDGGWGYKPGNTSTAAMTVAGLATLFIAEDEMRTGSGNDCHGNASTLELDRGMAWLASHFTVTHNPPSNEGPYYYLFGLQRVGVASGFRYIGTHDWYDEGSRFLLQAQGADGAWPAQNLHEPIHTTAFAILFLARGGQPTLVNKLSYEGNWNQRPRDAAHLSRYFGHTYEREFQWQVVDISRDPADFHNAPLLYLAGKGSLRFSADQKDHLRRFIEEGGMLLGNADCADEAFAKSFSELLTELFPQYPLRKLPDDHLIFKAYNPTTRPVEIVAQSNGVREWAMLVTREDLGRALQHSHPAEALPDFDLATNICLYAADPGTLKSKYDPYIVWHDPRIGPQTPGYQRINFARIRYDGNWDPEPGGWRRLADILHNQYALDLRLQTALLGDGTLPKCRIAHLTGTGAVHFNAEQMSDLQAFFARGGLLLVDAAGGSTEFAKSIEPILNSIIPQAQLKPLPPDDPLLGVPKLLEAPDPDAGADPSGKPSDASARAGDPAGSINALKPVAAREAENLPAPLPANSSAPPLVAPTGTRAELQQRGGVDTHGSIIPGYRRAARQRVGADTRLRLQGIALGRQWLVIYSTEDLSAGLVGQNVDGVIGYTPAVATEIVRRIVANVAAQTQ